MNSPKYNSVAWMAAELNQHLQSLPEEERLGIFSIVAEYYCKNCGKDVDDFYCQCMNDD